MVMIEQVAGTEQVGRRRVQLSDRQQRLGMALVQCCLICTYNNLNRQTRENLPSGKLQDR